jgi:hypothetical protein
MAADRGHQVDDRRAVVGVAAVGRVLRACLRSCAGAW